MKNKKKYLLSCLFILLLFYFISGKMLSLTGNLLISDMKPQQSDVIVVLNTGIEYYPRLIEAADLYKKGLASKIIINGNRKTDILRDLEKGGFDHCCTWYEDRVRILELLGVPRTSVLAISAEGAYDTVSEALAVGNILLELGTKKVIVTTSKFHTRRAGYIWSKLFEGKLKIQSVSAKADPYEPDWWWKEGRQIRWVLAEYGGWLYDWIKLLKKSHEAELQISYIEPFV